MNPFLVVLTGVFLATAFGATASAAPALLAEAAPGGSSPPGVDCHNDLLGVCIPHPNILNVVQSLLEQCLLCL